MCKSRITIMVPKDDICNNKETLQQRLSHNFTEHNGVVAPYINITNTVGLLHGKQTPKETAMIPKQKLLLYSYIIDVFSWIQLSTLPLSQCVLTWGCVSNLGKQTLKQLPWNRIIMTKKGEQECKTCLENWLYNIKIRLLLHIWHFI